MSAGYNVDLKIGLDIWNPVKIVNGSELNNQSTVHEIADRLADFKQMHRIIDVKSTETGDNRTRYIKTS